MAGLAPKLPLTKDSGDGYTLVKTLKNMIKQNFKMLILTVPGERVMVPEYGVGMKRYLFNNFNENTYAEIDSRIREQVEIYMPFVKIQEVAFGSDSQDMNLLGVSIRYSIPRIGATDLLEFTI
jgi:phage baseplate assembly protein W